MNAIECLRKKAGLTQEQFAAAAGVTQSAVSQWESGAAFPSAAKLPKIARALGCTIADLYKTADAMT